MYSFARSALGLVLGGSLFAQTDLFEWTVFASFNVAQRVVGLAFSPDGSKGAIATADGAIQIFALENRILSPRRIAQQAGHVVSLSFSSDSSAVMFAGDDGVVTVSSLTGEGSRSIRTKGRLITAALSKDGTLLASSTGDGSVSFWDFPSGTLNGRFQHKSKKPFFALGFLGPDASLVAVSGSGAVYELDTKTHGILHHTQDEDDRITAASIGESGDLVAVGTEVAAFQKGPIRDLSLARPDNIARKNRIRIYDRRSAAKTLDGINGEVIALSLSRDGRFISFARHPDKDSFLVVYDVQRGVEVASAGLPARATAVAFSRSGQWLGAATERGDVLVRGVKGITNAVYPGDLRGLTCTITSKDTTPLLNTPTIVSVAVMDFVVNSVDQGVGSAVADMVRARVAEGQNVRVVERAQMENVIKEQNFQLTARVDQATAVRLGQMLGARKMILGSVSKLETRFTVNVRMVDVETAVVDGGREITCEPGSVSGLQEAVIRLKPVLVR